MTVLSLHFPFSGVGRESKALLHISSPFHPKNALRTPFSSSIRPAIFDVYETTSPMGCFLACFGSSKRKRRKPKRNQRDRNHGRYESLLPISPPKQSVIEPAIDHLPEIRGKPQHLSFNSRKKVTFDLNVETYTQVLTHEVPSYADEDKDGENASNGNERQFFSEDSSNATNLSTDSFPSNHRYQNCTYSSDEADEEDEEVEYENSDFEDDDSDGGEEDSFESYFSRTPLTTEKIEDSRHFHSSSAERQSTALAKGSVRDRSQYIHSVLNPVENLTQWRAVKTKSAGPLKHQQKENANLELELEPTFKLPKSQIPLDRNVSFNPTKPPNQEISVNASFSSWLVPSTTMPLTQVCMTPKEFSEKSKTLRSHEDRPILGALPVEELKKSAVSSSPRRSQRQSSDKNPIMCSVGSYRHHKNKALDSRRIPNETSIYREVLRVK